MNLLEELKKKIQYTLPQKAAQVASSSKLNQFAQSINDFVQFASSGAERVKQTPPKEFFLPTSTKGQPFRQYVGDTAKSAYKTGEGVVKMTPAYQAYRSLTGNPVSSKEYGETMLNTVTSGLNTAWRVQPAAPIVGAGLQSWGDIRRYKEGKISNQELLNAPMSGVNEQPGFGQLFTDDPKKRQIIDIAFMATMILAPFAQKKLNEFNLKANEINKVSETLEVRPSATMKEINIAWKSKVRQYADVFAGRGTPEDTLKVKKLNEAYNLLKKTGVIDRQYAQVYDFVKNQVPEMPFGFSIKPMKRAPEGSPLLPAETQTRQAATGVLRSDTGSPTRGLLAETPAQTKFRREQGLTPQEVYTGEISAFEKRINEVTEFNKVSLQRFNQEQEAISKSQPGVKAYKGGKIPQTSSSFPSEALRGFNSKDKPAFSYQRETLLRNIEETFKNPNDAKAIKEYFYKPIIRNETANVEFQNDLKVKLRNIFNKHNIKKGSKEDFAAADFIEGKISELNLREKFPKKAEGIIKAADSGREIYKSLLTRINQELTSYGYEPIPERKNYVTHTQEIQTFMDTMGNLVNLDKDKLPTAMASVHLTTKPGRTWFRFKLPRTGESTHEGLITALEKYLPPAGNQIFHTGDIQRGRALEQFIQKQNEGTQFRSLSNFESYISQYIDSLAGKQNIMDRPFEKIFGRSVLRLGDWLRKKTGANMVGGNMSSAMTNFIPFTQSVATTSKSAVVRGLFKAVLSPAEGITNVGGVKSNFLVRRFPEGNIQMNKLEKVKEAANVLFKMIDGFTAKSIVAAKYFEGTDKGLSPAEAMANADEYAARVLADRSYGQVPLIFKSKVLGVFLQFQVEVNNQVSFLLKDIPRNSGYSRAKVVSALTQFVIYAYVFNTLFEKITGRRPQIDPLHSALNAYQRIKNKQDWKRIVNPVDQNTPVGEIVSNLPFLGAFSGGRIPIGSAVPNPLAVMSGQSTVGKEIKKPLYYLIPPTAGGQAKKLIEGVGAYDRGYSQTDTGKVRFPVTKNIPNFIRSAAFGQYSTPEARKYFDENLRPLSEKQSSAFKGSQDKKATYQSILEQRKLDSAVDKVREKVREGGQPQLVKDVYVYWDSEAGETATIDFGFEAQKPTLTGKENIDKKLITKYKGQLTKQENYVIAALEQGLISEDIAGSLLDGIQGERDSLKKGKKPAKVTIKKVSPTKAPQLPKLKKLKSGIKITKAPMSKSLSKPNLQLREPKSIYNVFAIRP